MDQEEHPLDTAAKIVGSHVALAAALGVSKGALPQWKMPGRRVPAEYCPTIERLTKGGVRCEALRPDIAWDVLREQSATVTTPGALDDTKAPA